MEIATARIKVYTQYREAQAMHDEQDDFGFYDTYDDEEEPEYFDTVSEDIRNPAVVKNDIDWDFYLQCLIGIAVVAGGAMLVVGLLLPIPGLAIAGACVLGVGVVGYFSSHPSSEDEEDGLPPRQPYV